MMQPLMFFRCPSSSRPLSSVRRTPRSPCGYRCSRPPRPSSCWHSAMTPAPPMWQVLLSLVSTASTTAGLAWAAGRVSVSAADAGKPPNLPLLKWI